nr:hypothetical protein CFP56_10028 [Quercus suber]
MTGKSLESSPTTWLKSVMQKLSNWWNVSRSWSHRGLFVKQERRLTKSVRADETPDGRCETDQRRESFTAPSPTIAGTRKEQLADVEMNRAEEGGYGNDTYVNSVKT